MRRRAVAVSLVVVGVLTACGSSSSTFDGSSEDAVAGKDPAGSGDRGSLAGGGAGASGATPAGIDKACATSTVGADPLPVTLVFSLDRSGSMLDQGKWSAATGALKAFFSAPAPKGTSASLGFFCSADCNLKSYSRPAVPAVGLPNAGFAPVMDQTLTCEHTPTGPAIRGALDYAKSIAKPAQVAPIVLVTDGLPESCGGMVAALDAAKAAAAAGHQVFVIGVGNQLTLLDSLAKAGDTGKAILVDTGDPAKTTAQLGAAIASIRGQVMTCDFTMPSGQQVDTSKVNVTLTTGGAAAALPYDPACKDKGWRYDDPSSPTRVTLCPATCTAAKADAASKVEIVLGCKTLSVTN